MSFYLKYRPRKIDDLDLAKVRENLGAMLKSGSFPKSLLLVGPRGGGKTSTARIIAKVVNCQNNKNLGEPCLECEMCRSIEKGSAVDILEMDAASNRGIDAIRDLREKINLTPVQATFKVYIIDEVHMLTTEAFNALLKTLEEPPQHAMFILCTTEEHKIPETILSRCTKITFYKASSEEVKRSLMKVVKGEKLKVDKKVLDYLAENVDGSFREGHKLLEILSQEKVIDLDSVKKVLGQSKGTNIELMAELYLEGKTGMVLEELRKVDEAGVDWLVMVRDLLDHLRGILKAEYGIGEKKKDFGVSRVRQVLSVLAKAALEIKGAVIEVLPLEIAAVELGKDEVKKMAIQPEEKPIVDTKDEQGEDRIHKSVIGSVSIDQVVARWDELLKILAPKNHSVAGLLRATRPKAIEDGKLVIEVFYQFHKEQLEQDSKRRLLEEALSETLGLSAVKLVLGEGQVQKKVVVEEKEDEVLSIEAENIFGG